MGSFFIYEIAVVPLVLLLFMAAGRYDVWRATRAAGRDLRAALAADAHLDVEGWAHTWCANQQFVTSKMAWPIALRAMDKVVLQDAADDDGTVPCSNCNRPVLEDDGRHVDGGYNCEDVLIGGRIFTLGGWYIHPDFPPHNECQIGYHHSAGQGEPKMLMYQPSQQGDGMNPWAWGDPTDFDVALFHRVR